MSFLNRKDVIVIVLLALVILVALPLALDPFRLNSIGKYLLARCMAR